MAGNLLVFVNTKQPDFVEVRQLGEYDRRKRDRVDDKVGKLVMRIKAGEEEESNGNDRKEFPGWSVLESVV